MKSPLNISLIAVSLLACAALSLPATAVAQATDAEAEVQAEQERPDYDPAARAADYYEQAAQAYEEGNFERAAELLHRAFAHEPNLIYKYNEILALLGSGDYQRALDILDTYREPLAADSRFDDVDELEEELLEAQAAVEAKQQAQAGEESPSEPVVVEQPSELTPDGPEHLDEDSPNILAWSLLGTGGALLGGGAFFASGLLISDEITRLNDYSAQDYAQSSYSHDDDVATLGTHRTISVALLSAGAIATATGVGLLFFGRSDQPPADQAGLQLAPIIDQRFLGATLSGRF